MGRTCVYTRREKCPSNNISKPYMYVFSSVHKSRWSYFFPGIFVKKVPTQTLNCRLWDIDCRMCSKFGLVYWGLTPQKQPVSYRGSDDDDDGDDDDDEMSVSLVEETGVPGGNLRPTADMW